MNQAYEIIANQSVTYHQQVLGLAGCAESTLDVLNYGEDAKKFIEQGVICTMFEGNAPYRPRYVIPDYEKLMKEGCKFLRLDPPKNIWEATNTLLIFYRHVPSITSFPVYIGNIDLLLEPFVENEDEAYNAIKLFLMHIDRSFTDSFVHGNIGPKDTKAGRMIIKASEELSCAIPNLTLKYEEGVTSEEFAAQCASVALKTAKPSFAHNALYTKDFGTDKYAIASCYNGFLIGGGGYSLVRLCLNKLAPLAKNKDEFFDKYLPNAVNETIKVIDERCRFLIEESAFFKSNFLVKEEFVKKELFSGMFGIIGLAEAVNHLLSANVPSERYGHGKDANELGLQIIEKIDSMLKDHKSPYVECFNGNHFLHAQVGIDTDSKCSPGCRIPVGEEPILFEHILQSAPFHKYFYNGIGDIFVFEDTYNVHPEALVNIIKGSFKAGLRYFSAYGLGCDVVRVTGYLVKKSEVEVLERGEAVANNTVLFGMGAKNNCKAFDRKHRRLENEDK